MEDKNSTYFFIGGKEMKNPFTPLLAVLLISSIFATANAEEISTPIDEEIEENYAYTIRQESSLKITSKTCTCLSKVFGKPTVTKISITQKLQKKSNGSWTNVKTWSKSYNSTSALYTNSKTSLSKGTYRTRTVAKVYSGSNYETVTGNSSSVTI